MKFEISIGLKVSIYISSSVSQKVEVGKIFDKFYKADNSRSSDGSGLGLYICRKFVEDMKGKISAESSDTRFNVKIELELFHEA